MAAWHENARFDVFGKCDVFIENGIYIYVEEQPFDFYGNYSCRDYQQGRNSDGTSFYMYGEPFGMSNDRICSLEKAPWKVARDVIATELKQLEKHEEDLDEYRDEDMQTAPLVDDARRCLLEYATQDEVFTYC